ncbi:MAG TPA: hypothetical protein VFM51_12280, partial [Solirubrobacterales bacterium]|nr:hypothetical protein [Solirubrobacterales bacterium]
MSKRNALIGGVLAIVAVVALIVLSGGEEDDEPITGGGAIGKQEVAGTQAKEPEARTEVPTIVIGKGGKPIGGIAELSYKKED